MGQSEKFFFPNMGRIWSESPELRNAADVPTGLVGAKLVLKLVVFRVQPSAYLWPYLWLTLAPGVKHIHLGGNLLTERGLKAGILQRVQEKVSRGMHWRTVLVSFGKLWV